MDSIQISTDLIIGTDIVFRPIHCLKRLSYSNRGSLKPPKIKMDSPSFKSFYLVVIALELTTHLIMESGWFALIALIMLLYSTFTFAAYKELLSARAMQFLRQDN